MSIIIEYLKAEGVKNDNKFFTVSDLLKYLRENHKEVYDDFKLKLFESIQKLNSKECPFDILKEKLQIVLNIFGHTLDEQKLKNKVESFKGSNSFLRVREIIILSILGFGTKQFLLTKNSFFKSK